MNYSRNLINHRILCFILALILSTSWFSGIASAEPVNPGGTAAPEAATSPNPADLPTQLLPDAQRLAYERLMSDVQKLDDELEIAIEEFNAATVMLNETDSYLVDMQEELDIAQAEFDARKNIMDERVSALYKNGSVNILEVLLSTKSFSDFIVRLSFLVNISLNDSKLLTELEDAKNGVENTKAELEGLRTQQLAYQQELDSKKSIIEQKFGQRKQLLDSTSMEIISLINAERERRAQEAANILAKARAELNSKISKNSNPIVAAAFKYLGIPYVWGGTSANGLDCSGLVMLVFAENGIPLPHYSRYQSMMGLPIQDGVLKPGDLVFFGEPIHHVGIYVGGDYFIHAPKTGDVVKVSILSERKDFVTARRFAPMATAADIQ